MATENELTPEEKLLRVIQKGGAAPAPGEAPGGTQALTDDAPGVPPAAVSRVGAALRLMALARGLSVLAAALVAGAGYEIYANIPVREPPPATVEPGFLGDGGVMEAPRIGDTVDAFAKRRVFGKPGETEKPPDPGSDEYWKGWRAYIRDNFRMMGISTVERLGADGQSRQISEAIVVDNKKNLMHFLSIGQSLVIETEAVSVESVSGEEIVFASGDTRMNFKK